MRPDPGACLAYLLERRQETHRLPEYLLGSEQLYGELKGLPQGLMIVGEHEYHRWESPTVQLEWQCQVMPCVLSSNPCLILYPTLDHLGQSNWACKAYLLSRAVHAQLFA
jgi:hypothetical protein